MDKDALLFHGDNDVQQLADYFGLDSDETLTEWTAFKEFFGDVNGTGTTNELLNTLLTAKPTVGEMFQKIVFYLCVHESLILSTAAVERVFSKVKLIVNDHRNRLAVTTVNKLLNIGLNVVVKLYLSKKKRRILSYFLADLLK